MLVPAAFGKGIPSLQPHLSHCNRHFLIALGRETEEIFFEGMCQSPK